MSLGADILDEIMGELPEITATLRTASGDQAACICAVVGRSAAPSDIGLGVDMAVPVRMRETEYARLAVRIGDVVTLTDAGGTDRRMRIDGARISCGMATLTLQDADQ